MCTLSKLLVRPVHLKIETKGVEQKKIQKEKHQVTSFTWPSAYKDWIISIIRLMKKRPTILWKLMSRTIGKRVAKKCVPWVRLICHNYNIDNMKTYISLTHLTLGWKHITFRSYLHGYLIRRCLQCKFLVTWDYSQPIISHCIVLYYFPLRERYTC